MTETDKNKAHHLQKKLILLLLAVCVILLGAIMYLLATREEPTSPAAKEGWDTGIDAGSAGGVDNGILVPGYETVVMTAGTDLMPISIGNPKENLCFMKVTLLLGEDTVLYQSDLLPPGQGMDEVQISQILAAGTYDAAARFEFFQNNEEHTPLNTADSGFVLIVKEE